MSSVALSERPVPRLDSVYQVPAAFRALLVLTDVLPLYLIYCVFVSTPGDSRLPGLAALCSVAVSALTMLFAGKQSRWFGIVSALAIGSLCAAGVFLTDGSEIYGFGSMMLVIGGLIRTALWMRTSYVTEHNRRAFRVDTAFIVCGLAAYLVFISNGGWKTSLEIAVLSCSAILVRLFTMWTLTRMESFTASPVQSWLVMAVFGAAGLIVGALLLVFSGIGFAAGVESGMGFILFWLFPNMKLQHPLKSPSRTTPMTLQLPRNMPDHPAYGHAFLLGLALVGVSLLLALVVLVLRGKQKERRPTQTEHVSQASSTRTWVKRRGMPKLVAATDPVRLAYQAWLRQQYKQDRGILPSDTARRYQARWREQANETGQECKLFANYERVRYEEGKK